MINDNIFEDKIIEIKDKYYSLEKYGFKYSLAIMMLLSSNFSDDDLCIIYNNKEECKTIQIYEKEEAINYIKNGKLKDIIIYYSKKYIDSKIIDGIKSYLLELKYSSNNHFPGENKLMLEIIINKLLYCFLENMECLMLEAKECYKILISQSYENEDDIYLDSDEFEDDDNTIPVIDELINTEGIEDIINPNNLKEIKEDITLYTNKRANYKEINQYLKDEEYLNSLIKKYYMLNFDYKETIYLEPNDNIELKINDDLNYKYRKMLLDMYNKLILNSDKDDAIKNMIDIINGKIDVNKNFYTSYIDQIKDYNKFFSIIKFIIISDYYKSFIDNQNIIDENNKPYITYIKEEVVNENMIKELYEYENNFAINATLSFINYNSINHKIYVNDYDKKILEKIDPFKK